ncbi:hypothetical protein MMC26_001795 [Xylographa opegraphella]|nr:hypothetical protein [Xylographa opegraphella]
MSSPRPKDVENHGGMTRVSKEPEHELQNLVREGNMVRGDVEKPIKSMSNLTLLAAAWNILNTWWGFGAVFAVGITHGGPVTLIYGMMLLSLVYGATALSLAELSAHYPTAGGQYHWTHLLAPKRLKRLLSYCCAIANVVGRLGICAGVTVANAQFIMGLVAFNSPGFTIRRWHIFLLYQGINVMTFLYNAIALYHLPGTHQVGCILSIVSFFAITITCLAMANSKQSSRYVWTTFVDESGWQSSAATFLTGLTCPNFGLGGLDGPIHLSEDTFNPARTVPMSILVSLFMGCISALLFVVVMLYCITNLRSLISSATG